MSRTKRITALTLAILAVLIFCGTPFQQSAKAAVLVDDALIAIIIAALAAFGITFTMSDGYYNAYDWVASQINDSGANFTGINVGVNSLSQLLLNNKFVRELSILAMYIKTTYNLQNNATQQLARAGIAAVDELTGNIYYPGIVQSSSDFTEGTELFHFNTNGATSGTDHYYYFRFAGIYYRFTLHMGSQSVTSSVDISEDSVNWTRTGGTYSTAGNMSYQMNYYDGELYLYQIVKFRSGSAYSATAMRSAKIEGSVTGYDLWIHTGMIQIPDGVELDDKGGILSLPLPWGESYGEVISSIPGLTENDELAGNTTLTLEGTEVVEGQVDQTATNQQYVSQNLDDYRVNGLSSVFPFCIPFDIYNFFDCLAADPVAPHFVWRFYVPGICDENIDLDLAEFDTVAQIVRTMELLAFIVGLAVVTRNKFLRG